MKRFFRLFHWFDGQQTANGMSLFVVVIAILILHFESSPTPAGGEVARRPSNKHSFVLIASKPEAPAVSAIADINETAPSPEQLTEFQLNAKIRLIEKGLEFLAQTPHYTAQFIKQELVNGELLDEQEIEMKVRHAPFSVYLKWVTGEAGREVLYVDGHNDGRLTAHGGGWKARLPAVSLEPTSRMAMAESRYPVTSAGLHFLAKMMLDIHRQDLQNKTVGRCEQLSNQVFDGRPCHAFLIEYKDQKVSEQYRKSLTLIDKEWSIPIYTKNYGWPERDVQADSDQLDDASLIEFYSYSNVQFQPKLVAVDFDRTNEEYGFRR